MFQSRWRFLALVALVASACDGGAPTISPKERGSPPPRLDGWDVTYPLHWYGDATDSWPYIKTTEGVYTEIMADVQEVQFDDGRRTCPNDQLIEHNAHLRMNYGLETLDFDFRGPFTFIRHVSTTSPFPTAAYRFHRNAYTRDNKYYAPAGGQVLLACDGRYIADNRAFRIWVGHLYGKNYTGSIVRNPDYEDPNGGAGGTKCDGPKTLYAIYDPYSPEDDEDCDTGDVAGGGGDGSGTQFEPGDNTEGETVDWGTGVGNGGVSACGSAAVVDYVCIYYWNDSGQKWDLFACGYATTC